MTFSNGIRGIIGRRDARTRHEEKRMITLTPSACDKVKQLLEKEGKVGHGLRVRVAGGGCSGLQYSLGFDREAKEGDKVLEINGVKVFVDPRSALYLAGVEVDYVDGLSASGFKINNPNAKSTCGCGESFSA